MNNRQTVVLKQNKRLIGIVLAVPMLLLIPLLAMLFTDEVKWTLMDFIAAGILLLGAGLTFEFILRKVKSIQHKIALGIVLLLVVFLVWAELAVGIFGTPFGGH